jgi:biotin carboxyl carrier protein
MEHEFSYNGKIFPVNIERDASSPNGEGYRATVEGIAYGFTVSRISFNELTLFIDGSARRVYAVSDENRILVHIDGHVLSFDKVSGDSQIFSRDTLEFGAKDHVATPMPGKVVKILVKEGEKIALKQPLVIVESMKMENEIKSPVNGIVKSIHFGPGDLVEPGKPIIEIDPET